MKRISTLIIFSLLSTQSFAQTGFVKTFSLGKFTEAHKVIQTSDSGFIVCGATTDTVNTFFWKIFLLKLDKNGDSIWSKKYGPFSDPGVGGICQLSTGEFIIGFDTHVAGYDLYLNFLETNDHGDSLFYIPADTTFSGGTLRMGPSENIYVSGARGYYDYYWNFQSIPLLRKYNKNLQLVWEKQIASDQNGQLPFAGNLLLDDHEETTVGGGFNSIPFGPIINEIDSTGNILWYLTQSEITSLACTGAGTSIGKANGGIIFSIEIPFTSNILLTNLDSLHTLLWQKQISVDPIFFHQWSNGDITMMKSNFGYMDISDNGDSIDFNEDYVLDNSSLYGVTMCYDQSIIAVGVNCNTCYWDSDEAYIVKFKPDVVGIENLSLNTEMILPFPNPSDKNVALNFSSPIESIALFSTGGILLRQFNHLHQSKFDLDVSDLSSGMYFISTSSNNKIYRGKILVGH